MEKKISLSRFILSLSYHATTQLLGEKHPKDIKPLPSKGIPLYLEWISLWIHFAHRLRSGKRLHSATPPLILMKAIADDLERLSVIPTYVTRKKLFELIIQRGDEYKHFQTTIQKPPPFPKDIRDLNNYQRYAEERKEWAKNNIIAGATKHFQATIPKDVSLPVSMGDSLYLMLYVSGVREFLSFVGDNIRQLINE